MILEVTINIIIINYFLRNLNHRILQYINKKYQIIYQNILNNVKFAILNGKYKQFNLTLIFAYFEIF